MKPNVKFVAFVAASVDGRIAKNPRSTIDWTSAEDWRFLQNSLRKFDAAVCGYNTYKVAEKNLKKRNAIVFTSKVRKPEVTGSVTFFNPKFGDIAEYVQGKGYRTVAVLGGPHVYDFFLKRGLLDEIYVTIEPYIFSAGVPMFEGTFAKRRLTLRSVKKLNRAGTVLLRYTHAH